LIDDTTEKQVKKSGQRPTLVLITLLLCTLISVSQEGTGILYRNPRVYNVDYRFELCPDRDSIDPSKDLKLWIPVPGEWDAQKAVRIISVGPEPHAFFTDPEYGKDRAD
jgi:hypothetical protein